MRRLIQRIRCAWSNGHDSTFGRLGFTYVWTCRHCGHVTVATVEEVRSIVSTDETMERAHRIRVERLTAAGWAINPNDVEATRFAYERYLGAS